MRLHLHIRYRGGVAVALPNWGRLPRIWTVPGKLMRCRSSYVGSFTYVCLAASFFPSLSVRISVLRGRMLLTTALQNSSALSILEEKPMEIYCLNLSETLFCLLPPTIDEYDKSFCGSLLSRFFTDIQKERETPIIRWNSTVSTFQGHLIVVSVTH